MTERQLLIVNVTRDERVHGIIENVISANKAVSAMFERKYMKSLNELLENVKSADVLFSFTVPEAAAARAANLKWLHFASAGVEKSMGAVRLLADRSKSPARKIKVTCSRGIHASTIAEYVMMQMLAFSKNLRKAYDFQQNRQWGFEELLGGKFDLDGKIVAIIGLGSIGMQVAKLARGFGMKVVGTVNEQRKKANVDRAFPPSKLKECLRLADFVLLSTPLTERTHHLIGFNEFSAMKASAFLINIGRGKLIDEGQLIGALEEKRIAGAALDVFETEPLPPTSPLWQMKNVSITPHYAGMAEGIWEKVAEFFCENAIRYRDGKRMLGIVNPERGY
jgi:phosphoglycerate dehydrogenase-like enzyme